MLPDFATWLEHRVLSEGTDFTSLPMKPGDVVYFGAHDILKMPDDKPIDRKVLTPKLGVIQSVSKSGVVVSQPSRHNFRMKLPIQKSKVHCDPTHLHRIEDEHIADEMDVNKETGERRKLFIYTPNKYTSKKLRKKSDRVKKMAADASPAPLGPQKPITLQDIGWPGANRPQPAPVPQPAPQPTATAAPNDMMTRDQLKSMGTGDQPFSNPYRQVPSPSPAPAPAPQPPGQVPYY